MIKANLIDLHDRRIFPAELTIEDEKIIHIEPILPISGLPFLMPGFIDAHVHVESSMLVPSEFARLAVVHGLSLIHISEPTRPY